MKKRILTSFTWLIAAAVAATATLMVFLSYQNFERRMMENLRIDVYVLAQLFEESDEPDLSQELTASVRVTHVAKDGSVLFDSRAAIEMMENHADRPEIVQAFAYGEGRDVRNSETVDHSTFYYAVRLSDGSVLRAALETSSLLSLYVNAVPLMLLVLVFMLLLCVAAANLLTRKLLQPLEQMTKSLSDEGGVTQYAELEPFMNMIKTQHEEILRSADMRVQFTANVSHELKTPLTSISGYAELIESGMASGQQATHFAGEIRKSADRLLALINDIIRLSQMDSPMPQMNLESVDLAQVAASVTEQLRLSAEKMQVALQLDSRPSVMQADRGMMEELVYNLCDNAIRYNVRGGSVKVDVRPLRDKIVLCVQDTGIGIPKEHQARIFERFYRVDKSRSKATGGTGLGLAIVKHIAANHHADIRVSSEQGVGTAITVTFDTSAKS